jgi:hypothetical protein
MFPPFSFSLAPTVSFAQALRDISPRQRLRRAGGRKPGPRRSSAC